MKEVKRHDPIQGEIIHEYDGIEEADNKLPQWWLWSFYLAIAFAAGYWLWYEEFRVTPGPLDSYALARMEALDTGEEVTEPMLAQLAEDSLSVRGGAQIFATNCAKCHGSRGEGNIGPNLTDEFWIGGGSAVDIYTTIVEGRDGKGMQGWGLQLGPGRCKQVTAYLLTLRDSKVPGKPPEGKPWSPPVESDAAGDGSAKVDTGSGQQGGGAQALAPTAEDT